MKLDNIIKEALIREVNLLLESDSRFNSAYNRAKSVIKDRYDDAPWLYEPYRWDKDKSNIDVMVDKVYMSIFEPTEEKLQNKEMNIIKFLPTVTNILINNGFFTKKPNTVIVSRLRHIFALIKKMANNDEIDWKTVNFNASFDEINQTYGKMFDEQYAKERHEIENAKYDKSSYKVVLIDSFGKAQKYGKYTYSQLNICYSYDIRKWLKYTDNGANTCYLLLSENWKEIPEEKTEGYPKDAYGLSMIWVIVNELGQIEYSNVRWNHGDNSFRNVDSLFNGVEISQILGMDYTKVLIPRPQKSNYTKTKIFDNGNSIVMNDEKLYNLMDNNGNLLSDRWCFLKDNGIVEDNLTEECNVITENGEFLFKEWLKKLYQLDNGLYFMQNKNDICNIANRQFRPLLKWVFYQIGLLENGDYIVVNKADLCNLMKSDFTIASKQWFYDIDNLDKSIDSFYSVMNKDNLWNAIDRNGNLISPKWYTEQEWETEKYECLQQYFSSKVDKKQFAKVVTECIKKYL